ncbi:MAG: hypothetical protein GY714_01070 [Desulfobacterales bacterium]|nr:hypothetical protein [Desulfobacterales bacterium]MCP4158450.1 hypothetical protein [Deltaproteobacteria bacterium]
MKKIIIYSLFAIFMLTFVSSKVVSNERSYPKDVLSFIEKRDSCDHFRGEPVYSKERQEFLIKMMNKTCKGTDKQLSDLKNKYKNNKEILKKLNEYDDNIEGISNN